MAPKERPLRGVWAAPKKSVGEASVKAKGFGTFGKDEDCKGKFGKGKDGMPKKSGCEASVKGKGFGTDKDGKGKYGEGFCKGQHGKGGKGKGNTAKAKETKEEYNARHFLEDRQRAVAHWERAHEGREASEDRSLPKATPGPSVIDEGKGEDSELAKADAKPKATTLRKIAIEKQLIKAKTELLQAWTGNGKDSELAKAKATAPASRASSSSTTPWKTSQSELAKAKATAPALRASSSSTPWKASQSRASSSSAPWSASQPAKDVDVYCGRCCRQFTHAFIKQAMVPVDCSRRWMYLASCFQPDCRLQEGLPGKFITLQPAEEETFLCALASWGSWALIDHEGDDNPTRQSLEFLRRKMHPVPRAVTTEHAKDDSGARASTDEPWKAHILIAERHQAERAARQQAERAREVNGEEMGNKLAPVTQRSALAAAHGPSAPVSGPKYPKGNPPKLTGFPVVIPKPPKHPPPPPPPRKRKRNSSPLT